MIIIETPTGNHEIDGEHLEVRRNGRTLHIHRDGQQIAAFKEWTNWRTVEKKDH